MGNGVVHFEVMGGNTAALVKFYGELFGWHIEHNADMDYGVVDTHAGSGINGGVGASQDGSQYSTVYIGVDDIDATLKQIEKAGGSTAQPKLAIPNVVTFAHFTDPAGNRIGLVEGSRQQPDAGTPGQGSNAEVGWFEIMGANAEGADALAKFYTGLFGWKASRHEMGPGMIYHEVDTGAPGMNGGIGNDPSGKGRVTIYAGVDDITKTLEQAETLGGKTVMPETQVTPETTIGLFLDPQGDLFGLYKRMPR